MNEVCRAQPQKHVYADRLLNRVITKEVPMSIYHAIKGISGKNRSLTFASLKVSSDLVVVRVASGDVATMLTVRSLDAMLFRPAMILLWTGATKAKLVSKTRHPTTADARPIRRRESSILRSIVDGLRVQVGHSGEDLHIPKRRYS